MTCVFHQSVSCCAWVITLCDALCILFQFGLRDELTKPQKYEIRWPALIAGRIDGRAIRLERSVGVIISVDRGSASYFELM